MRKLLLLLPVLVCFTTCNTETKKKMDNPIQLKVNEFAPVKLTADLSKLSANDKKMITLFVEAAKIMDSLYWLQAYGNKQALLDTISDKAVRTFVEMNYGPWERLDGNKPFVAGFGAKPAGAGFYPTDMLKDEFEKIPDSSKSSLYTVVVRNADKSLAVVPYHVYYKEGLEKASSILKEAAQLASDNGLKKYLELRAQALLTSDYYPSDIAWMDMKTNPVDFVIGPIENYEDELFGYKAAFEAYVLVKDMEWSKRLEHYSALLPALQKSLPVDAAYKKEMPGSDSDLGVYDAVYYAGDCNAGSKTIAINLPNDEKVQSLKGSRKLQLRNTMHFKFDKMVVPISNIMISADQRKHIKFDSFFENTMFHEVAHGLGVKNLIHQNSTVREALKEQYSAIEEAKADILGLYLVSQLIKMGELKDRDIRDNYVTFVAGIFRSVRFGASSAHGKANMITFAYFQEHQAFTCNPDGTYSINFDKIEQAVASLSEKILVIQGNGDYTGAKQWIEQKGIVGTKLQAGLNKIAQAGIPRDLTFDQGIETLGLNK